MRRILSWMPWFRVVPHRRVGRPLKRWDDDRVTLAGDGWPRSVCDKVIWDANQRRDALRMDDVSYSQWTMEDAAASAYINDTS